MWKVPLIIWEPTQRKAEREDKILENKGARCKTTYKHIKLSSNSGNYKENIHFLGFSNASKTRHFILRPWSSKSKRGSQHINKYIMIICSLLKHGLSSVGSIFTGLFIVEKLSVSSASLPIRKRLPGLMLNLLECKEKKFLGGKKIQNCLPFPEL